MRPGDDWPEGAEARRRARNAELLAWASAAASAALFAHALQQGAAPAILAILLTGGAVYLGAAILARRGVAWAAVPLVAGPLLSIMGAVAATGRLGAAPSPGWRWWSPPPPCRSAGWPGRRRPPSHRSRPWG
jgi:hypothetical protein